LKQLLKINLGVKYLYSVSSYFENACAAAKHVADKKQPGPDLGFDERLGDAVFCSLGQNEPGEAQAIAGICSHWWKGNSSSQEEDCSQDCHH